jgi:hypothetical protein
MSKSFWVYWALTLPITMISFWTFTYWYRVRDKKSAEWRRNVLNPEVEA